MADNRYNKTVWQNGHSTPLNQSNLNKIENELELLDTESINHDAKITEIINAIGNDSTKDSIRGQLKLHTDEITALSSTATSLQAEIETLQSTTKTLTGTVSALVTTVGDATTGLQKEVGDLTTQVANNKTAIDSKADASVVRDLTATVSTNTQNISSLTSQVNTLEQAIKDGTGGGEADSVAWNNITGKPSGYNPTSHASSATTYGLATVSAYGHVKISNGDVDTVSSTDGVVAGMDHTHSNYATKTDVNNAKVSVVNNLTSTSTTAALSAAQGKQLNDAIASITGNIENLGGGDMMKANYDPDGDGVVKAADNATTLNGHADSYFATATHTHSDYALTSHNHDSTYAKAAHTHSDYVNQNAYSNIVVGSTTIAAGSTTGTITFAAGSNVTLTPDASGKKITIASSYTNTDTKVTSVSNHYTPAKTATLSAAASATSSVASWGDTTLVTGVSLGKDAAGHITDVAVTSIKMPSKPETATIATNTTAGLVKSGGDISVDASTGVVTVADNSHNHTIANITNLQSTLDGKQATITGAASTVTTATLTASRALVSNSSGKIAVSGITATELSYLDGVTSSIQSQLDALKAMMQWQSF